MNPNSSFTPVKQSHTSFIVALLLAISLVLSLAFGVWAFIGMQENKSNLDENIATAEKVAVKNVENAKEIEFGESKSANQSQCKSEAPRPEADPDGFMNIPDGIDEELPFN